MDKAHLGTATRRPRVHVYLSDEAYEYLCEQAEVYQYISSARNRHKSGFSDYIAALSRCKFQDTRTQDIRDSDLPRLESGHLPYWNTDTPRKARFIAMTNDTQERLRTVALDIGITNVNRPDSVDIPRSPISAMLEAVGIKWLTPVSMIPNPHPPLSINKKFRSRPYNQYQ